jgi:hypothetical protein
MAPLFGKNGRTINEHLRNLYSAGELDLEATLRNYRRAQTECTRQVSRDVARDSPPAILAVG